MKSKLVYLLLITFMAVISTACWDTKDISDRAYIASLGIDKVSDESLGQENIPIKYKITAEIIKPSLLKVNSWQLDPEKKTTILISAEGETIQKALDLLQIQISRPLTLSHLQAVLVGERIADNFQDIRTFFGKHPEIARRLRLVFVKNHEAAEVLNTVPKLEHTVAHQLIGMIEISKDFSLSTFKPFTTFLSEMRANDGQALGGAINLSENQSLIRSGSAVFDKWKLVGWLNAEDTRKASLLMPKSQRNTFVGELKDGVYTYITDKNKVQIIPQLENGRLKFLVKVKTVGAIAQEEGNELNLAEPKNIAQLEELFTQIISKEVNEAIAKSQKEFKVDYFGFGLRLMDKEPDFFESIDWKETFPTVPIITETKAKIHLFGIAK